MYITSKDISNTNFNSRRNP